MCLKSQKEGPASTHPVPCLDLDKRSAASAAEAAFPFLSFPMDCVSHRERSVPSRKFAISFNYTPLQRQLHSSVAHNIYLDEYFLL